MFSSYLLLSRIKVCVLGWDLAQIMSLFYYKIFYYKIISVQFCNITISHSSTSYDILGEMFKIKL